MKIELKAVRNEGDLERERVVFRIKSPDDIGNYMVSQVFTTNGNTEISSRVIRAFWFPDQDVKSGDLVILYTKKGANKTRPNTDGSSSHFFYWGLDKAIWNTDATAVVYARLSTWEHRILTSAEDVDHAEPATI